MSPPENDSGLRLQRPNLVVADMDRALELYRDILGFRLDFMKESTPDGYDYTVFQIPSDARVRFAVLSANDEQPRSLALTEVVGAELASVPLPRRNALVLNVKAFDEVVTAVRREGLLLHPEELLKTQDGRTGREIGFVDHDGHLVVIYTITRAARG
ncbi:MAG: VOC family protein [Gammaproteobacteria bacterium]